MKPKACKDCAHFQINQEQIDFGECRGDLPVVVVVRDHVEAHWPKVCDDDWCSKFTSRESEYVGRMTALK